MKVFSLRFWWLVEFNTVARSVDACPRVLTYTISRFPLCVLRVVHECGSQPCSPALTRIFYRQTKYTAQDPKSRSSIYSGLRLRYFPVLTLR